MKEHFFIIGAGRCGTKLLRKMLILHPKVNICVETHFLPKLYDLYQLRPITFEKYFSVIDEHYDSKGSKYLYNLLKSEKKNYKGFKEDFANFCQDIKNGNIIDYTEQLQEYLYSKEDYLIGDKTPHYGTVMILLKKIWPDAKFIHLVRDGVYTSQSMTYHPGFKKLINAGILPHDLNRCTYKNHIKEYSSKPIEIEKAAVFWEKVILKIQEQAKAIPRADYYEIKYEDLIKDPEKTLNIVAQFLNIRADKKWLNKASLIPKPFFLNRIKKRISKQEYKNITDKISNTMQIFGYPLENYGYDSNFKEFWRSLGYYKSNMFKLEYWRQVIKNEFKK